MKETTASKNIFEAILLLSSGKYIEKVIEASNKTEAQQLAVKEVNSKKLCIVGSCITPLNVRRGGVLL